MKMESARKGGIELAGDNDLRRIGKYSNKNKNSQKLSEPVIFVVF